MGVRARERNALERIEALEGDFQRLVGAVQQSLSDNEQKLRDISEVLDATVTLFGAETVQRAMADKRLERAKADADRAKGALDEALAKGQMKAIEKVVDGCLVAGVEKDAKGEIIPPGYVQLSLASIKPEFVEKMKGQAVGFSFETEPGGSFEITGIYESVPLPAAEEAPPAAAEPSPPPAA